jgi:hypothetical protein
MPKICRQHRQASLDILSRAVPTQQGLDGESMAKVVQARSIVTSFAI